MREKKIFGEKGLVHTVKKAFMKILDPENLSKNMQRVSSTEYGREMNMLGHKADFVRKQFGHELPWRAALDNVMIIFGSRSGFYREDVEGEFNIRKEENLTYIVNGFYSPDSGRITAFGTSKKGERFTFIINTMTGKISLTNGRENMFLRRLDGMQVMEV